MGRSPFSGRGVFSDIFCLAEGKSRVIGFGRYEWEKARREGKKVGTFDFLGFTHYCYKTRRGKFKLGRKTSSTKFRQKMTGMNDWLRRVRNKVQLSRVVEGVKVKVGWALPLPWDKWKHAGIKEVCT
jgi:hypothetical protein